MFKSFLFTEMRNSFNLLLIALACFDNAFLLMAILEALRGPFRVRMTITWHCIVFEYSSQNTYLNVYASTKYINNNQMQLCKTVLQTSDYYFSQFFYTWSSCPVATWNYRYMVMVTPAMSMSFCLDIFCTLFRALQWQDRFWCV